MKVYFKTLYSGHYDNSYWFENIGWSVYFGKSSVIVFEVDGIGEVDKLNKLESYMEHQNHFLIYKIAMKGDIKERMIHEPTRRKCYRKYLIEELMSKKLHNILNS